MCRFFASEEYKTGKPPEDKVFGLPPFEIDTTSFVEAPINFKQVGSHVEGWEYSRCPVCSYGLVFYSSVSRIVRRKWLRRGAKSCLADLMVNSR